MLHSRTGLLWIACGLLALACAVERAVPAGLHGRWVSEDARFAGRELEIGARSVRFLDGNSELDAIVVRAVDHQGAGGPAERVVIHGTARDASPVDLAFELRTRPVEQLRLETQNVAWRRAAPQRVKP